MRIVILSVLFLANCAPAARRCEKPKDRVPACAGNCEEYAVHSPNITSYDVRINAITPDGIYVDQSGVAADINELDELTSEVENCLDISINRSCLAVKIAPDAYISPCTGVMLFPCDFPADRCANLRPENVECACNCTGTVQDENIIVVAPNLAAYKHELLHVVTGMYDNELELSPRISACAQ